MIFPEKSYQGDCASCGSPAVADCNVDYREALCLECMYMYDWAWFCAGMPTEPSADPSPEAVQ